MLQPPGTRRAGMGESGAARLGMIVRLDPMANLDIEQTRNQARALLDSRIESVTTLVRTRQRITELKDQLATAEREDKRAYVQATRDGWSPEELKKLGLEPAAAGRRRKAQTKAADTTTLQVEASQPNDQNAASLN